MSDEPVLLTRIDGAVATITLNRPEARNALNTELITALRRGVAAVDDDPEIAVIVLTGSDPVFCAGVDLKALAEGRQQLDVAPSGDGGPRRPFGPTTKPVIGAINGAAVTGGFEIAICCDFLIASERAAFADTHARVGVMPGWGLSVRLPRAIGEGRARQMSFTGNFIDAATALNWGLVNEVVPHDELMERAGQLALDVASMPAAALTRYRQLYDENADLDSALLREQEVSASFAFDREALANNRESIVSRGRDQAGG